MPIMTVDGPRMGLQQARNGQRKMLDLVQYGEVRGQAPKPVTFLRQDEPYLLGIHPGDWEKRRAVVGPAGPVYVYERPTSERRIDWDAVPADAVAVEIDARLMQNNLGQITQRVAQAGLHVIVRRYGERAAVLVPIDYLDDEESGLE